MPPRRTPARLLPTASRRTPHRRVAQLARDRGRLRRRIPVLHGGRGTTTLDRRARGGRRRHGGPALRLGRWLRPRSLALPRCLAQRGEALRRPSTLGLSAGGARPERQRDGVERGQPRGTAGAQAAGRARRAGGPGARTRTLRAQHGLASHRADHSQPSPRIPVRLRLAAARRASVGRQHGLARPDRGRGVSDRPPPRCTPGAARDHPAPTRSFARRAPSSPRPRSRLPGSTSGGAR